MVVLAFLFLLFDFAWFQSLLFAFIHSCFCSTLLVLVCSLIFFFSLILLANVCFFFCLFHLLFLDLKKYFCLCVFLAYLVFAWFHSCSFLLSFMLLAFVLVFVCFFPCIPSVTLILNFFVLFLPSNRNFHSSTTFLSCLVLLIIVFQSEQWGVFCRVFSI